MLAVAGAETAVVAALLQEMLADTAAGWSVGTFGALAEFHHVAADPAPLLRLSSGGGEVITALGAIRAEASSGLLPVAYEGLAKDPRAWNHGVSFCLRREFAGLGSRGVLTELGRDREALRAEDRDAVLFDVGIAAPQVDFCVRTADPRLAATLREAAGQSIVDPGHPAMAAIIAASPHRVCISRIGRVEVYQPIPSGPGARAPIGPHTHLLWQLLRSGRSHSANLPIPDGWVPVLDLHPANPVTDGLGRPRPFDFGSHTAFQALLRQYAPPGVMAEKARIARAVLSGEKPADYLPAPTRAGRKAARVALRQMLHTHAETGNLLAWLDLFDRGADKPDGDNPGCAA